MAESLTQQDRDALEALLNSGDRTGYYILYYELTGSQQALLQAQISSFSGIAGGAAIAGNAYAKYVEALVAEGVYPDSIIDFPVPFCSGVRRPLAAGVTP